MDGTGYEFYQVSFTSLNRNCIPGNAFTKTQEIAFVQGIGAQIVARGILTDVQMIMPAAASSAALGSLRSICVEVGYTVPESVTVELVLATD